MRSEHVRRRRELVRRCREHVRRCKEHVCRRREDVRSRREHMRNRSEDVGRRMQRSLLRGRESLRFAVSLRIPAAMYGSIWIGLRSVMHSLHRSAHAVGLARTRRGFRRQGLGLQRASSRCVAGLTAELETGRDTRARDLRLQLPRYVPVF